jgi:UPF0716 protein FxsA
MNAQLIRAPGWLFPVLVLLFTLLPLVELGLLVALGTNLGLGPTLLLCASTGFGGAWRARRQGAQTNLAAQESLQTGQFPVDQVADGALLLVGGVVLLTPGLITDAIGFALLIPFTRNLIKAALHAAFQRARREAVRMAADPTPTPTASVHDEIIDVEVIEE